MRKLTLSILFVLSAFSAPATELYVYATNSVILSAPRELPSVGVRLDTRQAVLGLYSADPSTQAACGWFRCVAATSQPPAGMVIASRAWLISGAVAAETLTYKPAPPPKPYEISKYKLLINLKEAGALPAFADYLSADAERKMLWDAATTLDSTNAMVTAAMSGLSAVLGIPPAAVSNIVLRSAAQ